MESAKKPSNKLAFNKYPNGLSEGRRRDVRPIHGVSKQGEIQRVGDNHLMGGVTRARGKGDLHGRDVDEEKSPISIQRLVAKSNNE